MKPQKDKKKTKNAVAKKEEASVNSFCHTFGISLPGNIYANAKVRARSLDYWSFSKYIQHLVTEDLKRMTETPDVAAQKLAQRDLQLEMEKQLRDLQVKVKKILGG